MIFVSCGLMAQNEKDSQGRKQGKWSKSYPNGQIQYEGQFKDDRETGTFTYYNQDGSIAQTIEYKADTGHATAYYKNKKVMSRGTYVDRKKNGLWQYFTEKGRKIKEETFEMGVKNGEERLWDKQGNLLEKVNYENGVRQGECYQYMYSDGYCIYDVKEGKKNGRYTCYYESKKKKAEGNYVNDDKEGEWVFYSEDGQVLKRQIWKADRLQDELLFNGPVAPIRKGRGENHHRVLSIHRLHNLISYCRLFMSAAGCSCPRQQSSLRAPVVSMSV